ncbi:Rieske (2Fe-2S) protein [Streptomyces sp. NPDC020681]|uniref:Rieske (2Fe-2S) protein n=1 Tax=Streptomyces sp. NPDC020681 TaxID=3365083 RepID=UPI0037B24E5A
MDARRRTVLTAGAAGVAALVTGCGDGDESGGATTEQPTATADTPSPPATTESTAAPTGEATGSSTPAGEELAKTADIPVGGGKVFAEQKIVVTQPTAGQFKAFSAVCTHQGCTVNAVADGTINCPCHGSKFSVEDAAVEAGPAQTPLPQKQITVSGDTILLP